jgi:CubicO group peptidase (beta-lactamase class C family)
MKYFFTFILLSLSITGLSAQENFNRLDSVLTLLAKEEMFHGQVLVAEQGEVKFSQAYGKRLSGQPITGNTPIDIQSVAKGITAISILQLHEAGKLNINDPLSQYFPSLAFYKGVQVRHILNHTSGLPRFFEVVFSNWPQDQFLSTAEMVELVADLQPDAQSKPGEYEAYNQTAYMLLAEIVEQVAGQSFTAYVRQHIFKPAGMTHTFFNIAQPGFKTGLGQANLDNLFALMVGDGGIQSTADDLFSLDRAISNGTIISPKVMTQAYQPARLGNGTEGRYGYGGSLVEKEAGKRQFQHIGQGTTSNAVFTRFIDTGDVLIVLHEQSVQYAQPVYVAVKNIWEEKAFSMPQKRIVHQLTPEQIHLYVGDYGDNGFMHLTTENGKLYIQPDGNPSRIEIIPSSDTTFYFEDQDMNWQIYLDDAGQVIGFGPAGEPHIMKRWKK